jgi:WD40 repeat protein
VRKLQGHISGVSSIAFSPDGNRIVSGFNDKSMRVWDTRTGEQVTAVQRHTDWVTSVAFSPDGNRIVSGSKDNSVHVWDAKTGERVMELQGHTGVVDSVAFSPDGNRIVSGSWDNSVRVWDNLDLCAPSIFPDGWIDFGGEMLVWVPSTIGNILLSPHNTLIISRDGFAKISFVRCKLGPLWQECYTP